MKNEFNIRQIILDSKKREEYYRQIDDEYVEKDDERETLESMDRRRKLRSIHKKQKQDLQDIFLLYNIIYLEFSR